MVKGWGKGGLAIGHKTISVIAERKMQIRPVIMIIVLYIFLVRPTSDLISVAKRTDTRIIKNTQLSMNNNQR